MSINLQIRILLLSQFLIIASLDMVDPYWPLILGRMNTSGHLSSPTLWVTLIYMAPFFMMILMAPFWGYIGKYCGYKKMIIRASLALAFTQLLISISHNVAIILVLRLVQGGFSGFTAASQAWLVESTHEEKHGYLIGKIQAIMAIGAIFGPVMGGVVSYYFHYGAIFLISGAVCFLIGVSLMFSLEETKKVPFQKSASFKKKESHQASPVGLFLLTLIGLSKLLRWMSASFFALYVLHKISGNNLTVGILYGAIALLIYISAPCCGKLMVWLRRRMSLLKSALILPLFFAALAQLFYAEAKTIYMALFASCILGICLGAIDTIPFALLIQYSKSNNKGFVIGLGSSVSKLGNFLGVGLGGYVYVAFGMVMCFRLIAVGYLLLCLFVLAGFTFLSKRYAHRLYELQTSLEKTS